MHNLQETRFVTVNPKLVYQVIVDVAQYQLFLPWCSSSEILHVNSETEFLADLTIIFQGQNNPFRSTVIHHQKSSSHFVVQSTSLHNHLFSSLQNKWEIKSIDNKITSITCSTNIVLKTQSLDLVFSLVRNFIQKKIIHSFIKRIYSLQDVSL